VISGPNVRSISVADYERIRFYLDNYDVIFRSGLGPSSPKTTLGSERLCRFCGQRPPQVTFRKLAHAAPELLGNKRLFARYECDECNQSFGAIEGELAKYIALELFGSQIKGKAGIPCLRSRQKLSRAEVNENGFLFKENKDDRILWMDAASQTLRLKVHHQRYRPLGAFKALTKVALTLTPEPELPAFEPTLQWLRAPIDRGSIMKPANCLRSFVPGPRPIREPYVVLFRRRHGRDVPYSMLFLATGNTGFQVIVPCPDHDKNGSTYEFLPVPIAAFVDPSLATGGARYFVDDLTSDDLIDAPSEATFHVELQSAATDDQADPDRVNDTKAPG
jgi:hypothetical protein